MKSIGTISPRWLKWRKRALRVAMIEALGLTFILWFSMPIQNSLADWFLLLGPGLILICSAAIAWKWQLIGGILLFIEGLLLAMWFIMNLAQYTPFLGTLFIILLLPSSGFLFLFSWRIRREHP